MPRQPRRRRRLIQSQPLTFSPFARSLAQAASAHAIKREMRGAEMQRNSYQGDEHINNSSEKINEQADSSEDEEFDGVVQADFAFFDPKPDDFHGVKVLLQSYLDDKQWDLSGFVDLILAQTTVGTVVKIEDDEDNGLFSVITALNLNRYKDHTCIMELKEFLLKSCQEEDMLCNLKSLLNDQGKNVGLLVSQRVVNLPPQLLPPLYDALFDEVLWATEDEPTADLRNSFHFKFYLIVSKIYMHKNANKKKKPSTDCDEALIYIKPEDEMFHKLCSWSFFFPLHIQHVTTQELRDYRSTGLVMAVGADKISAFRQQLPSLIDES